MLRKILRCSRQGNLHQRPGGFARTTELMQRTGVYTLTIPQLMQCGQAEIKVAFPPTIALLSGSVPTACARDHTSSYRPAPSPRGYRVHRTGHAGAPLSSSQYLMTAVFNGIANTGPAYGRPPTSVAPVPIAGKSSAETSMIITRILASPKSQYAARCSAGDSECAVRCPVRRRGGRYGVSLNG